MIKKIMAGWFVPLAFAAGTAIGDDATIRRFKAEYPAASQKLQTFYSNLRMSGTESSENESTRWEFCGNGESLRTVVGSKSGASYVFVANAKLSFDLKKPADSSRYSVTTMGSATEKELDSLAQTIRKKAYPAAVSYAILTDPISGFIAEKSFRIGDAREVDGPGGKVIRVDWENSPQGGPKRQGSFDFAPDGSWALRGYDFYFTDEESYYSEEMKKLITGQSVKIGRHGVVEYEGMQDGVPLVRRVRTWNSGPGGTSPETHMEVEKLTVGPVPQREFELGAFGVSVSPAANTTPVTYYLLAMAALSAILVLVIRFLQSRAARPASPL